MPAQLGGSKDEEWLLIARAGIQKTGIEPEWSAPSVRVARPAARSVPRRSRGTASSV